MIDLLIRDHDGETIQRIKLSGHNCYSIGRFPDNSIVLEDIKASRKHAEIEKRENEYVLIDVGSSLGTHLNEEKIDEEILHEGDVIRIGKTKLEVIEIDLLDMEKTAEKTADTVLSEDDETMVSSSLSSPNYQKTDTTVVAPENYEKNIFSPHTSIIVEDVKTSAHQFIQSNQSNQSNQSKVLSIPEDEAGKFHLETPMLISLASLQKYPLSREETFIGRDKVCDIAIPASDNIASGKHAFIRRETDGCRLLDIGSTNGTYVNNKEVQEEELNDEDIILIGKTQFIFFQAHSFSEEAQVTIKDKTTLLLPYKQMVKSYLSQIQEKVQMLGVISELENHIFYSENLKNMVDVLFCFLVRENLFSNEVEQIAYINYHQGLHHFSIEKRKVSRRLHLSEKFLEELLLLEKNSGIKCFFLNEQKSQKNLLLFTLMSGSVFPPGFLYFEFKHNHFSEQDVQVIGAISELFSNKMEKENQIRRKRDLDIARRIQESTFHQGFFRYGQGRKLKGFGFNEPAEELGGDYFHKFWQDPYLYIFIGDVKGKGINAALIVAAINAFLTGILRSSPKPLKVIARELDEFLCQSYSDMFTTMLILQWDSDLDRVTFINLGHCSPLLCSYKEGWSFQEMEAKKMGVPLGINKKVARMPLGEEEIALAPHQFLCLYTDGVTELIDPQMRQFGLEGVKQSIGEITSNDNLDVIAESLIKKMARHRKGRKQSDDISFLLIAINE